VGGPIQDDPLLACMQVCTSKFANTTQMRVMVSNNAECYFTVQ